MTSGNSKVDALMRIATDIRDLMADTKPSQIAEEINSSSPEMQIIISDYYTQLAVSTSNFERNLDLWRSNLGDDVKIANNLAQSITLITREMEKLSILTPLEVVRKAIEDPEAIPETKTLCRVYLDLYESWGSIADRVKTHADEEGLDLEG